MRFLPAAPAPSNDKPQHKWSDMQEAIFEEFANGTGNLKVVALAGSAKTTSILEGVNRAPESNIWVAAYNKSIQLDIEKKITNPCAVAKTLHGVGMACIKRKWGDEAQGPDNDRGYHIAEKVLQDLSLARSIPLPKRILESDSIMPGVADGDLIMDRALVGKIVKWVDKLKEIKPFSFRAPTEEAWSIAEEVAAQYDLLPETDLEAKGWSPARIAAYAIEALKTAAAFEDQRFDFTDMIFLPLVNGWTYPRFDMVCADEAQDMTNAYLTFTMKMVKAGGRIVIVGDKNQSLYGFRGADPEAIDRLGVELKAKELPLTICYRCPLAVIREAQRLVPSIQARPGAPEGIVREIEFYKLAGEVRSGDVVLSRVNAMLMKAALGALRLGKPVTIIGKELGEALVKLIKRIDASKCSLREFSKSLHEFRNEQIQNLGDSPERSAKTKLEMLLDQIDSLEAILNCMIEDGTGRDTFHLITQIRKLFTEVDPARVTSFSTIHRIKGKEADRVFVLRDTLYVYGMKRGEQAEKNIEYVAITRAKKELIWVFDPAKRREAEREYMKDREDLFETRDDNLFGVDES